MAANVPLSVLSAYEINWGIGVVIGTKHHLPDKMLADSYWFLVVDRFDLDNVVANVLSKSNNEVPAEVAKYAADSRYLLIVATIALKTPNLPQGQLRELLSKHGGNNDLDRVEQIYNQFSCGQYGWVTFCLVGVMGDAHGGFSTAGYGSMDRCVLTLNLQPSEIDGQTIYSPIANTTHTYTPVS